MPFDRTKAEWEEHYRTLCWPSLCYGDPRIKELADKFEVTGIPQLIILDTKTGFCITKTARKDIVEANKSEEAVKQVFQTWGKLFALNKVKGQKRATQDSIALS